MVDVLTDSEIRPPLMDKRLIGEERSPLLVIDDAMTDPDALVELAGQEIYVRAGAVYPGIRAPVDRLFERDFQSRIAPLVEENFGARLNPTIDGCSYSIVTIPPDQLAVNQRTPHTDANAPSSLAFILYLCDPAHGGTSFYRHHQSRYERITPDRAPEYNQMVAANLKERTQDARATFVTETDRHFERIATVECRFNRMAVYPGNLLHSGDIRQPDRLSQNHRTGRLTITGFLELYLGDK